MSTSETIKTGAALFILDKFSDNPRWSMEENGTFIQMPSGAVHFYHTSSSPRNTYLRVSTDADMHTWSGDTQILGSHGAWSTLCRDESTGIIYAIGAESAAFTGGLFAYKSTDGINFTPINGGLSVLDTVTGRNSLWNARWNTKLVILDGVFHLWVDTSYNSDPFGSINWGQGYSYSELGVGDTLDFNTNKCETWVIPQGNSNEIQYLPERNALFILDAHFDTFADDGHGAWYSELVAWSVRADSDFTNPANYTLLDYGFNGNWYPPGPESGNRRSISDPAFNNVTGKNSKVIMSYNYDQNSQCLEYSDKTLVELYDAAGGVDYSGVTPPDPPPDPPPTPVKVSPVTVKSRNGVLLVAKDDQGNIYSITTISQEVVDA